MRRFWNGFTGACRSTPSTSRVKPAMTVIGSVDCRASLAMTAMTGRTAMTVIGRLTMTVVILVLMSLAPLGVFALPEDEGGGNDLNITVEYRYTEGGSVDIPSTITQFGREYRLVDQSDAVLESMLPSTRTYTYKIEGLLSEEELAAVADIPGLVLTPALVEVEREVDKTEVFSDLPTNDLDQDGIPEYLEFDVSSALAENGTAKVSLKRAGVSFKVTEELAGLPEKYEATVVYRGTESYLETGYYSADMTYETSVIEGGTPQYVIIATYQPADAKATRDDTGTEIDPGLEPESPDSEFSENELMKFSEQTGNPVLDILNGNVPLGSFFAKGAWSLLSVIFSLIAVILSVFIIVGLITKRRALNTVEAFEKDLSRRKKLVSASRIIVILLGIAAPIVCVVLDDFSLPMVWINQWTAIVGAIFLAQIAMFVTYEMAGSKVEDGEPAD